MGAHPRGAMHDGALDHPRAARVNVLDGEVALHGRDRADGLADAAMVVAATAEQAGLVEMDVGVDETRQDAACRRRRSRPPRRQVGVRWRRYVRRKRRYRPGVADTAILALRKIRSKAVFVFIAQRVGGRLNLAEARSQAAPDCVQFWGQTVQNMCMQFEGPIVESGRQERSSCPLPPSRAKNP